MRKRTFVPAILSATGARALINTDTLPLAGWAVHSGKAPVSGEEVHSLRSQKIAGTNNIVLKTENDKQLCVTLGEAERFSADYLKDLGYTVNPPAAG